MQPKFTVVIPSYNRAKFITKAIESVKGQTLKNWKLLIVDDNSSDNTLDKIADYLKDRRIKLIKLDENKGISHVLNVALDNIDTEYFVQLDSDDWLAKDALEQFNGCMNRKPNKALYYGNVALWTENEQGRWVKRKIIKHRAFVSKYQFLAYMTYMLHPRCYQTAAVRSVGGWDTDDEFEGRMMEDRRMCVKLIEKYPIQWIDKVLYHRRKHINQLTNRQMYARRNILRKRLVERSLRKWGDKYEAEYGYRNGLLVIKNLKRKKQ